MRSLADLHCCTFSVMFFHEHIVLYCILCKQYKLFFNQIHRKLHWCTSGIRFVRQQCVWLNMNWIDKTIGNVSVCSIEWMPSFTLLLLLAYISMFWLLSQCLLFFVYVTVTPNVNIADRSSFVKLAFHRMFPKQLCTVICRWY